MEVYCADDVASEKCRGKNSHVVALAHQYLGLASVVSVSDVPEHNALELKTATGCILVDYDLQKSLLEK